MTQIKLNNPTLKKLLQAQIPLDKKGRTITNQMEKLQKEYEKLNNQFKQKEAEILALNEKITFEALKEMQAHKEHLAEFEIFSTVTLEKGNPVIKVVDMKEEMLKSLPDRIAQIEKSQVEKLKQLEDAIQRHDK